MQTTAPLAIRRAALALGSSVLAVVLVQPAYASGVRAGTVIRNTATASYNAGAGTTTITSNTVDLTVDEVLDAAVAPRDSGDAQVRPGATGQVRSFTVTNAGNGPESFALTADGQVAGDDFDPTPTAIALDSNGNGTYESGVDLIVGTGGATPSIDPDAAVTVFVLSSIPNDAADAGRGAVRLVATATTGSGTAGTVFAGRGDNGGDAVVGATTARAFAQGGFVVSRASLALVKSAVVADPFGGVRAVPGSRITYRLAATLSGSGTIAGLKLADAIPTGTRYAPGTLKLDGAALTDGTDGDAGVASAAGIEVALGTPAAGGSHAVEFTVIVD